MSNEQNNTTVQEQNTGDTANKGKKSSRKMGKGFRAFFGRRGLRYSTFNIVLIVLVIAAVVLVNVGVSALDSNWDLRMDLTENGMYHISTQTEHILQNLTEPISLIGLYPEESLNELTQLLNRYRAINPQMINVRNVDIARNPTYAQKFVDSTETVPNNSVVITNADETKYRVVSPNDMFELEINYQTGAQTPKAFIGEQVITNAIVYVVSENQDRVFFLQGHAEAILDSYNYVIPQLEQRNAVVGTIEGTDIGSLLPEDILVIVSPQRDLSSDEREAIKLFLENGGHMLYLRGAGDAYLENFTSLMQLYGVTSHGDLVVDSARATTYGATVIVPEMKQSPITEKLIANNMFLVFPFTSSFDLPAVEQEGRTITPFLTSSGESYGKVDPMTENIDRAEGDLEGPRTLGVAIEQVNANGTTSKIAAFGNSYFITDEDFSSFSGNGDLFFNAVSWIQGETGAINIVGKSLVGNSLALSTMTQFYSISALVVGLIPAIALIAGLFIYLKRRHL